ncbi:MAG: erythromycin esterase family protein, partial [Candidatus Rokubacteria bacterium]|nr:erythromycin esterase family protein [Candidatus Rokubacteria bacterium]
KWLNIPWYGQNVGITTNIAQTCNAFWNGSTLNFFRSGGGCNNTGEIRDVMQHEWGHGHDQNDGQPPSTTVGFYGIDLYSLITSIEAVLSYLDKVDPEGAKRGRYRYSCFDHFGDNTQAYSYAAAFGMSKTCEDEVVNQLLELTRKAGEYAHRDGRVEADEYFYAEQNARLVNNPEEYYRTMFRGRVSSWNLRDSHMVETLQALVPHLEKRRSPARIAVWAHNSHLGDAAATDMGEAGEWNVGQLMRERYARDVALIGFSTHHGTVTAASDCDRPAERKRVRLGLLGSHEELSHDAGLARHLEAPRLQRAIGVIYLPETERQSHYFHTRLPQQFDAMIHFDETRAVEPLEPGSGCVSEEAPDTYPTGI